MAKNARKAAQNGEAKRGRGRPPKEKRDATNLPDPNEVAKCFGEMQAIVVDQLRLNARADATLKRYERTHGVDPASIKRMLREAKKDPAEIARQLRLDREYRRMVGLTRMNTTGQVEIAMEVLQTEGPVPNTDQQARLSAARAHMDGYNSGLAGGNQEHNRHAPGTEEHVKWLEGWHDGHADRLAKNPDAAAVTEASTRRQRREPTPPANDEKPVAAEIPAAASVH